MSPLIRQALRNGGAAAPVAAVVPLLASINAAGWTGEWADGTPPTFTPDTSPETFSVTRAGFVGVAGAPGSVTAVSAAAVDTITLTRRLRQAYPNQALNTASTVVLSAYLYSTDVVAGVTNNSAETSPKPICGWTLAPDQMFAGAPPIGVIAFHRNGIAAVRFTITDGTTTVIQTVTAPVVEGRTGDQGAVLAYRFTADISALANGLRELKAEVYPRIGGAAAVLDSSAQALGTRDFCNYRFRKGAKNYVYVDAVGVDATGVVSTTAATAEATPCLTVKGAIERALAVLGVGNVSGVEVRLNAGSWDLGGAVTLNTYQNADSAELTLTRNPNVARAAVTFTVNANSFRLRKLGIQDLTLVRSTNVFLGVSPDQVRIRDCDFNNNSVNFQLSQIPQYWEGGVAVTGATAALLQASTGDVRMIRGVTAGAVGSILIAESWHIAGSKLQHVTIERGTRSQSGMIIHGNFLNFPNGANHGIRLGLDNDVVGAAIGQNVREWTGISPQRASLFSADSATGNVTHLLDVHNTTAGAYAAGADNVAYDETTGTNRLHKLWLILAPLAVSINNKGDIFKLDGAKTGNWPIAMGVDCYSIWSQYRDLGGGGFDQEYPGLNASIGTSNTVRNDPLFVDYEAVTYNGTAYTAGAGGGDYSLQVGSPAKARVPAHPASPPFDFAGNPRSGTTSNGAYV